jgi:hypothetical protein
MARSSKDIAKRLRFDWRPRPDAFRRWYAVAAVVACGLGAGVWLLLARTHGERQYLPGPVTPAHATFGDQCARCHVAFASATDERCLKCHAARMHSKFEVDTPACRDCHVEHAGRAALLRVDNQSCVACHGALRTTHAAEVALAIADFAAHPEFTARRPEARDTAALRFNHQVHFDPEKVRDNGRQPPAPLECADCHVPDAAGRYMRPIDYAADCQRCHHLTVTTAEIKAPINEIEAPHAEPTVVRAGLTTALLAMGVQRANEIFVGNTTTLLPGRDQRGPVDDSKTLLEFQRKWLAALEQQLYQPFVDTPPLLDHNKSCFLCHVQGEGVDAAGLPRVVETKIPRHWFGRAEFSHRQHDELPCATCHERVKQSALTTEVNLPNRAVCVRCHADGTPQSAGTACTLCHLYHDTSKDPARASATRPRLTTEELIGPAP